MMTEDDTAVEQYIRELETALAGLPRDSREGILDDVRAHIAEARGAGRGVPETLAGLGSPQHVAADARSELGVLEQPSKADSAARALHTAAIVLAILTAAFVSFLLPSYAIEELQVSGEPTGSTLQTATTLFEHYGLGIALLPLIPAAIAAVPLLVPARLRFGTAIGAATLMTVLSVIAGASIGGFFLPQTALLWLAVLVPIWMRRGASPAAGRTARIAAAVVIAFPMLFLAATALIGMFRDPMPPFWIAAFVLVGIAVLFAFRVRFTDAVVAVVGFGIMTLALLDAGVLTLVVWWMGSAWLLAGLCALIARRVETR